MFDVTERSHRVTSAHDERPNARFTFSSAFVLSIAVMGTLTTPVQAFQAKQRPLSDFINAQGATSCFVPPAPDQLGASSAVNKTPVRFALIDYTGLTAKFLQTFGINLGTTVTGTVLERPLADGRALITVNLHTKNALTWATNFDPNGSSDQFNTNPLLFGWRAQDLIADPARQPALADQHFRVVFTNTAPGAPLPDIVCINASQCPNVIAACPVGFELEFLMSQATAKGELHAIAGLGPEGTPGRLTLTQTGLIQPAIKNGFQGALADAFPAEKVELRATGK
jgi:hypothetical protein